MCLSKSLEWCWEGMRSYVNSACFCMKHRWWSLAHLSPPGTIYGRSKLAGGCERYKSNNNNLQNPVMLLNVQRCGHPIRHDIYYYTIPTYVHCLWIWEFSFIHSGISASEIEWESSSCCLMLIEFNRIWQDGKENPGKF